uniref:Inositol polyphosphate-5-phosphatase J n=1 Tax=Homo sapiens TaxID=9606 RepID=C9K0M5_HUMAN
MEGQSSRGSRRPGTRAGLGSLPMPQGVAQTGAPSKTEKLRRWAERYLPKVTQSWALNLHSQSQLPALAPEWSSGNGWTQVFSSQQRRTQP